MTHAPWHAKLCPCVICLRADLHEKLERITELEILAKAEYLRGFDDGVYSTMKEYGLTPRDATGGA
jgi:hypothetical protein